MPRKTKVPVEENPEDVILDPIEKPAKRKVVRKAPTARLSPSAGMGDIATPGAEEVIEQPEPVEHISVASHAVHAADIHGSTVPEAREPFIVRHEAPVIEKAYVEPVAVVQVQDEKEYLAPNQHSFNLQQKPERSGVATFFIWLLDIIIILGIVALFMLYKYPTQTQNVIGKVIPKFASQQTATTSSSSTTSTTTPQLSFRTATSVTALAQVVDTNVQSQFSMFSVQSSTDPSEVSSQNLSTDTILYKAASQSEAQQIATYLTQQFGIQPKMQESDGLQEDVLLYLTTTVANPNFSNDTAAVYNASGVSGAAKQYCTVLTNAKAASCTAANASTTSSGLQVSYKTETEHFMLARISTFANATFQTAPATQTQDIVVTIGS